MKKITLYLIVTICIGLIVTIAYSIFVHQEQLKKEKNNSLRYSQDVQAQFDNEQLIATETVQLAFDYIATHVVTPTEDINVEVSLKTEFLNPYMEWVNTLNTIYNTQNVDAFIQLFKNEEFNAWYAQQSIKNSPEEYIKDYMQDSIKDINNFVYFTKNEEHYIRINYKTGEFAEKKLYLQLIDETLFITMSVDEWHSYIQNKNGQ